MASKQAGPACSINTKDTFALLRPTQVRKPTRSETKSYKVIEPEWVPTILSKFTGIIAVDIETRGTQAGSRDCEIVGIGISNGKQSIYIDKRCCRGDAFSKTLELLNSPDRQLIGHNIFFDSAFLLRDSGSWYNWQYCTYGLYRQLANEGWPGQSWSLKSAQTELLGWQDTNEAELDTWLVGNNYYSDIKLDYKDGYILKSDGKYYKPRKGEMWRAPYYILGYYCCLDAHSTYHLYDSVLRPAIDKMPPKARQAFLNYHRVFVSNVKINVEQQLRGIKIDRPALLKHKEWLDTEIAGAEQRFLEHSEVREYIDIYNRQKLEELKAKEPPKFKKKKLKAEPPKFKKDGNISKVWETWRQKADAPLELSKVWQNWNERYLEAQSKQYFNLNSGADKRWLFYDMLKYPVIIKTDTGLPAVDRKALTGFGEVGQVLKRNNDLEKESGYVKGCLDYMIDGIIYPQFRIPGTLTGRLAGSSGLNLQQLPKSKGYLECWQPRDGMLLIDCDHTSLEQVVLAELSNDKTLLKLYGPGQPKQDVYLFNGSQLPIIGKQIRDAGYDPDLPTAEGIASAKKNAKLARTIAKVITLGASYGMGPTKLAMTLRLQGIDIDDREAKRIHQAYWDLYKGVKDYERALVDEWKLRKGWVYNGIGRPVGVYQEYLKDIVNRVVQSTGHDLHMLWLDIFYNLLKQKQITAYPWIADFHDQAIFECYKEDAEAVRLTYLEAYDILNQRLEGTIPLTGDPQIVNNLAEAKLDNA